jgi:multiple antibiotic resistance protein
LTLTFSSPGLSSLNEAEMQEAEQPRDIAVFPLAFPMIAGPASISAVILLMEQSSSAGDSAAVLALLVLCLGLTYVCMRASEVLERLLGHTGSDVIGRISGILLAAMAVQFVFDGLRQAGVVPALATVEAKGAPR